MWSGELGWGLIERGGGGRIGRGGVGSVVPAGVILLVSEKLLCLGIYLA